MRAISLMFFSFIQLSLFAQDAGIDSLAQRLENATTSEIKVKALLSLSSKYIRTDLIKALDYADKAIDMAEESRSDSLILSSWLNQGNIYLQLGNYSRAMQMYQQVLQDENIDRYKNLEGLTNGNLGNIHYYQRELPLALHFYLEAAKYFSLETISKETPQTLGRANLLNNIGIVYEETGQFDSASYYYTRALKLVEQLNEHELTANTLNNFGTLYRDKGEPEKAIEYYNRALALRERNHDKLGVARSNHNLGTFYFEIEKDYPKAKSYLIRAIEPH